MSCQGEHQTTTIHSMRHHVCSGIREWGRWAYTSVITYISLTSSALYSLFVIYLYLIIHLLIYPLLAC